MDSGWNKKSMHQVFPGFCYGSVILGVKQSLGVASMHTRVAMNTVILGVDNILFKMLDVPEPLFPTLSSE